MKALSHLRRVLSGAAALLLLALSWWAIRGGVNDAAQARNLGQQVETVIRFACGLLSVVVVVTRIRSHAWARPVRIAWAATLAASAGISALVWGPPMLHVALLFVAVSLLLAWAILWALGPARAAAAAPAAEVEQRRPTGKPG